MAEYLAPERQRRFWRRIDQGKPEECWPWTGALTPKGYGRFSPRVGGRAKHVFAQRYAYESQRGPVPEGLVIDHLCRNRACCNPAHLEPVSVATNLHRGETWAARNAAKTACLNGHPFDAENTYVSPKGSRECRTCRREAGRRWDQKKAARRG